jgi:Tat protein secretion system quality control protein TatD with DNase activity
MESEKEKVQKRSQYVFFKMQAELAKKFDLPLVIHNRKA